MLLKLVHFSNVAVQEEKVADALSAEQHAGLKGHNTPHQLGRGAVTFLVSLTHQREHKTNLSEASLPIRAQKILQ